MLLINVSSCVLRFHKCLTAQRLYAHSLGMNQLPIEARARILNCLIEGVSIRATARLCDVAINTVVKLQVEAGEACASFQDGAFRNLSCKRIECDEIWSFCYAKEKNVPNDKRGQFGFGDVWTWTAIDAE